MQLPSNFKNTISDIFYDKTISKYTKSSSKDDFGEVVVDVQDSGETFIGNVRFTNLQELKESYGIVEDIDISITTEEEVSLGDILSYDSQLYRVTKVIPTDSHNLVVAQEWSLKSTI